MANELLPVKDVDRDQIRLLARREVAACCDGNGALGSMPWREEFPHLLSVG